MATQGQRQNYQWRPNTYDSTTLTRYDQEASHWVRAFKNANRPQPTFVGTLGVIGLILQLVYNILWLVFYGIASAFVWLFSSKSGGEVNLPSTSTEEFVMPSASELDKRFENVETLDFYE